LDEESEGEEFDSVSSHDESSDNGRLSETSDVETDGAEDQSGNPNEDVVAGIPPIPTPPIEHEVQQRPHPRPRHRMAAPAVDVTDAVEEPRGYGGSQPPIREVPVIPGTGDGDGDAAEGENAVENERRYPRRSNCTNRHFMQGVDA